MRNCGPRLWRPSVTVTAPTLFGATGIPVPEGGCGALIKLSNIWDGFCIKVRRSSDNALSDIGFNASGDVDASTMTTFAAGGSLFIHTWYDQTSQGRHRVQTDPTKQYRIMNAGVLDVDSHSRAVAVAPDTARGYTMTTSFAAYTGTTLTGIIVGSFTNTATSVSPSFISGLPSNPALDDTNDAGIVLIARREQQQSWGQYHGATSWTSTPGVYNQLSMVTSEVYSSLHSLTVDGTKVSQTATTTQPLSIGRWTIGSRNGTTFLSTTGQHLSMWAVWHSNVNAQALSAIETYVQAKWHTTSTTPPTGTDPAARGLTLVAREDFAGGSWRTSDWVVYNNATSTSKASAWKSSNVSVVPITDGVHAGEYALELRSKKNTTVQTLPSGFTYIREGGAAYWKGPPDSTLGAAFKAEGFWRAIYRWVGKTGAAIPSFGHGFADLLWAAEGAGSGNLGWPKNGEPDIREYYPTNTNKTGGESNWHLDVVANSGRAQKFPPSQATVNAAPTRFSGLVQADIDRGSYGIDATGWHTIDVEVKAGQYYETWTDGVSHGRILHNQAAPSQSYVVYPPISLPFRRTFQIEHYNVADSAAAAGTFALQVLSVEYWRLP